jgi:hypothetical protein
MVVRWCGWLGGVCCWSGLCDSILFSEFKNSGKIFAQF